MLRSGLDPLDTLALQWLSADFRGRIIIDPLWRIRWSNEAGQRALHASKVLHEEGRQLIVDGASTASFSTFLTDLRSSDGNRTLTIKDGEGQFIIVGHHDADSDMFCLEVSSSHIEEPPLFADFRGVYGLTESESQAALALFRGQTVVEIAKDRNVSVDTVRTQVRKLYAKIGAQSREKLFKMLMPFRII